MTTEQLNLPILDSVRIVDVSGNPLTGLIGLGQLSISGTLSVTDGMTISSTDVSANLSLTEIGTGNYAVLVKAAANTAAGQIAYTVLCTAPTAAYTSFLGTFDVGQTWISRIDGAVSGIAATVWAYGTRTLTSLTALAADIASAVAALLGGASVHVNGSVLANGDTELYAGDDYSAIVGSALVYTITGLSVDFSSGATAVWRGAGISQAGVISGTQANLIVTVTLTQAQTIQMPIGKSELQIEFTKSGLETTRVKGKLTIKQKLG